MKDYDKRISDLQISMLQKSQWDWVIRRSIEPVSRQFRGNVASKSHVSMPMCEWVRVRMVECMLGCMNRSSAQASVGHTSAMVR